MIVCVHPGAGMSGDAYFRSPCLAFIKLTEVIIISRVACIKFLDVKNGYV